MGANEGLAGFRAVDHTRDPDFFVRFMEAGHRPPAIRTIKARMLERIALVRGEAVLDVGCGPGIDLLEMAEFVGAAGRLVGLDTSATMIAEAGRRAAARRTPAAFTVGDGQALPFPAGAFDVCRTERMLMHVADAGRALGEMVRVTRPGGRVAAFDFDHETMMVDSPDKETTRTIARTFADSLRHGWIGRQLPRLFRERGLVGVSVDTLTAFIDYPFAELLLGGHCTKLQTDGVVVPKAMRRWWENLRAADERGVFLLGFTAFVVVGTVAVP